jgi:hypothetical protein
MPHVSTSSDEIRCGKYWTVKNSRIFNVSHKLMCALFEKWVIKNNTPNDKRYNKGTGLK